MEQSEFEARLRRDGYLDIKTKSIDPVLTKTKLVDPVQPSTHSHGFDTRLLVLEGEATIVCGGVQRTYRAGDVMVIDAGVEHSESYGTTRFGFVVGLRHKPAEQPKDGRSATAIPAAGAH